MERGVKRILCGGGVSIYLCKSGKKIDIPPIRQISRTFKKAERHRAKGGEQLEIGKAN